MKLYREDRVRHTATGHVGTVNRLPEDFEAGSEDPVCCDPPVVEVSFDNWAEGRPLIVYAFNLVHEEG